MDPCATIALIRQKVNEGPLQGVRLHIGQFPRSLSQSGANALPGPAGFSPGRSGWLEFVDRLFGYGANSCRMETGESIMAADPAAQAPEGQPLVEAAGNSV